MPVDDLCVLAHLFILLRHSGLILELLPNCDLVQRVQDASEGVWAEIELLEVGATSSGGPVETCSKRVEQIPKLIILLVSSVLLSLPE